MCIILIFFFIILLFFAILLLGYNFICDGQSCKIFTVSEGVAKATNACVKGKEKNKVLFLVKEFCDDGIWPFAYISSAILCGLLFAVLPLPLSVRLFTVMFLVSFLVFYSIMMFFIHHYVKPIKDYISKFIDNNID